MSATEKKMAKIVYNACYGGFGLSAAAVELLTARGASKVVEAVT